MIRDNTLSRIPMQDSNPVVISYKKCWLNAKRSNSGALAMKLRLCCILAMNWPCDIFIVSINLPFFYKLNVSLPDQTAQGGNSFRFMAAMLPIWLVIRESHWGDIWYNYSELRHFGCITWTKNYCFDLSPFRYVIPRYRDIARCLISNLNKSNNVHTQWLTWFFVIETTKNRDLQIISVKFERFPVRHLTRSPFILSWDTPDMHPKAYSATNVACILASYKPKPTTNYHENLTVDDVPQQ